MRAYAVVRTMEGEVCSLGSGDLIGRSWSATLHVDDPRVSEAHAMVSLRGDRLRLLALRGRFAVAGCVVAEVDLSPGQRIVLAPPDVAFDVIEVFLPVEVSALRGDGLEAAVLHGAAALVMRPDPLLVSPTAADALAWVWPGRSGWRLRIGGQPASDLQPGMRFVVGGRTFELINTPLRTVAPTRDGLVSRTPLRIVARYETVHIHRPDHAPVVLAGTSARMVSELVAFGVPVAWSVLARELWPDGDEHLLRKRLDGALARLRTRLQEDLVRPDLVVPNGLGQFELLLQPGDVVEDQL